MPANSKDAWNEVGQRFSDLGDRLAERYRALGDDSGESAEEGRRKVEEALKGVREQLDRAFTSVGDTMRDPAAKESLGKAVSSLGEALSATFSEASGEIRKRLASRGTPPSEPPAGGTGTA